MSLLQSNGLCMLSLQRSEDGYLGLRRGGVRISLGDFCELPGVFRGNVSMASTTLIGDGWAKELALFHREDVMGAAADFEHRVPSGPIGVSWYVVQNTP